jgi:Ca2+-binding EF-hand superfamily protein
MDGYVTKRELRKVLEGRTYSNVTLANLITALDTDLNGKINYTEFLAAFVGENIIQAKKKIEEVFNTFDKVKTFCKNLG